MTMINIGKAENTYPGRKQSNYIAVFLLAANTEQHMTAPAGAQVAVFSPTGNFFCLLNGQTAAVPGATDTAGTNTVPELNPTVLRVVGGTTLISLVASATTTVTISFYIDTNSVLNT